MPKGICRSGAAVSCRATTKPSCRAIVNEHRVRDVQLNGVGRSTTVAEVLVGVKCAQLSLATELMKFDGMVAADAAAMCAPSALATCYNGFRFLYQKPGLPPTSPIEAIVCCI